MNILPRLRYSFYLMIFLVTTSQSIDNLERTQHQNIPREEVSDMVNQKLKNEISRTINESSPASAVLEDVTKSKRIHPRKGVDPNATLESKEDFAINNSSKQVTLVLNPQTSSQKPLVTVERNNATETPIKKISTEKTILLTTVKPQIKPIAKKPSVTYSADDDPEIIDQEKKYFKLITKKNSETGKDSKDNLVVEEPIAELSKEPIVKENHRQYFIYLILIFALPTFLGLVVIAAKRFRENWSTRQYRRVDFLVDGMYDN